MDRGWGTGDRRKRSCNCFETIQDKSNSIKLFAGAETAYVGGATTYAVGKVFIEHFESGGTFLDFDPEKMRDHFQELYEEGKQLAT